jgi:hypothetical protein
MKWRYQNWINGKARIMTLNDIAKLRLINQQISRQKFRSPKALLKWMGAMQAQDYAMSKWAVGTRLKNFTEKKVEAALNKGEIIRTHVLRPTWHLVPAEDIYWMLELTAPKILANMKRRHKELGLSDSTLSKATAIIKKALTKSPFLTREELAGLISKAKIKTTENRLSHLLLYAELKGLICNGPVHHKKQTYALLPKRVKRGKKLTREKALAELAKRYFQSHGPATADDFSWWSGLTPREAKQGIALVKPALDTVTIGTKTFYFKKSTGNKAKSSFHLLPAFDEFIISYKDRSATLDPKHRSRSISFNGIFKPIIIHNGRVIGLWKRNLKKGTVIIETEFFGKGKAPSSVMKKAEEQFKIFLGKDKK